MFSGRAENRVSPENASLYPLVDNVESILDQTYQLPHRPHASRFLYPDVDSVVLQRKLNTVKGHSAYGTVVCDLQLAPVRSALSGEAKTKLGRASEHPLLGKFIHRDFSELHPVIYFNKPFKLKLIGYQDKKALIESEEFPGFIEEISHFLYLRDH